MGHSGSVPVCPISDWDKQGQSRFGPICELEPFYCEHEPFYCELEPFYCELET